MSQISIYKGPKITEEVREAIEKKLKELEEKAVKEGAHGKPNEATAMWSVNYTTAV
jgi:hypothetical protein